ncbi:MAG: T9SS type A sorting domain-containing protein [Candidatus Zixiibacteriota bacterium]|nr:MAG: T9SS type A sorting domain-containing protein [candidate division Zixibacteria bacterium]
MKNYILIFSVQFSIFLYVISLLSIASADENSWSTNGPQGGRIYNISIHPRDNNTVFIGTIGNGIYKSTNGGQLWQLLESDILHDVMRDIEFHPNFPDTIFAGTLEGMYRSLNGGHSWGLMTPPGHWYNQIRDIEIHPVHDSLVFAVGTLTQVKSTDFGDTWTELGFEWLASVAIKVDPLRPDSIYMATQSAIHRLSLFRSEDLGETWYPWHNDLDTSLWAYDFEIDPVNSDIQYLCGHAFMELTRTCLEKTTNAGVNWFDVTPPNLITPWIISIAISPLDHNTIYACTESNGILKSPDGGTTWIEINNGLESKTIFSVTVDSVTGHLYLGTLFDGIFKSTDEGSSWQKISQNINDSECEQISVNIRDPDSVYVATRNRVHMSIDGAESWEKVDIPFPYDDISTNGILVDAYDPNYIYASHYSVRGTYPGGVMRSTDAGASWQNYSNGLPDGTFCNWLAMADFGSGIRRLFLSGLGIYYSDDLGESWNRCENGLPVDIIFRHIEISQYDPNLMFVGDWEVGSYLLRRSTDSGQTWTTLSGPPGERHIHSIKCDPLNYNNVFVCKWYEGVFKSTDIGETWQDISSNLPRDYEWFLPTGLALNPDDPENIYVSIGGRGVFVTYNGGQLWEPFNNGLITKYHDASMIFIPGDENRFYLATGSQSVWAYTQTETSNDLPEDILPTEYSLAQNYPNPFNSSTTIEFGLPEPGEVSLTIYDILGREVMRPVSGYKEAGNYSISVDMDEAGSGVYFYILSTEQARISRTMVLIK